MVGTEVAASTTFLQANLKAAFPSYTVQAGPVPPTLAQGAKVVVYELLSSRDVNGNGDARIYERQQWKVVIVADATTIAPLVSDGALLDSAIRNKNGTNAYGRVHYCQRRGSVSLPFRDQDTGRNLIQYGGIYELKTSAS